MIDQIEKENCFGCGACSQACPKGIISMNPDFEGFLYPEIANNEDVCIQCGKCLKVCTAANKPLLYESAKGIHYNSLCKLSSRQKSASGGAFLGLATYVIKELKGVVFGAAFDQDQIVRHISVNNIKDLVKLQNSKYVQSEIGNTYKEVEQVLKRRSNVLFSGTPCQISGLKLYLRKDYCNLITVDIVCHGVPSSKLLDYHIKNIVNNKENIKNISFRRKHSFFPSVSSFLFSIKKKRGIQLARNYHQDQYFHLFLLGLSFRYACYSCPFAQINRIGDFTIGDCDSRREYPGFHLNESTSIILINNKKAQDIWNGGANKYFEYIPLDIEREQQCNKQLSIPSSKPVDRDSILKKVFSMSKLDYLRYVPQQSIMDYFKLRISLIIPPIFKHVILIFKRK